MGENHETQAEDLGPAMPGARKTFIITMVGGALFIGIIALAIL